MYQYFYIAIFLSLAIVYYVDTSDSQPKFTTNPPQPPNIVFPYEEDVHSS